jgi:hypothetical protein
MWQPIAAMRLQQKKHDELKIQPGGSDVSYKAI